jgi:RNA 3'-terminal phosphate cyclase-like protein
VRAAHRRAPCAGVVRVLRALRVSPHAARAAAFEASFLRLLDKLSNGCRIQINETGTTLRYVPGVLVGGLGLEHECPPGRGVGYLLEALHCLAPFTKHGVAITLRGVTNEDQDLSADAFAAVTAKVLSRFGVEGVEFKIARRGAPPR